MNSTQTIAEAQDELFENLKEGAICPVCDRLAKIYKRTIHATMAKELISIYKIAGHDWFYLPQQIFVRIVEDMLKKTIMNEMTVQVVLDGGKLRIKGRSLLKVKSL